MTLNLTVVTRRCIYQSADYRLLDLQTAKTFDFETQKIFLVNCFTWNATVCFSGVGRTHDLDVSDWLGNCVNAIGPKDPFDHLLDELMKADEWLSGVPSPHNKHSFSIGAFIGSESVFALISNFEQPSGIVLPSASLRLSQYVTRTNTARTFVSGQRQAITRYERKRLAKLAARDPEPQRMYTALVELNREVAARTPLVSPACFTTHLRLTGEGGGQAHGIDNRPLFPKLGMPPGAEEIITKLLDEQLGSGRAQLNSVSIVRADESDDYYEVQLREKPDDANTHSNYGAFLQNQKKDLSGAEREYRRALELDPRNANALNNLGFLSWEQGNKDEAEDLFHRAVEVEPGHELALLNYASFLLRERDDPRASSALLDSGIARNPDSGRLLLFRAGLSLNAESGLESVEWFLRAREKGADQAAVEAGYAFATHLSGASIGKCMAAYLTAITLNPANAELRLNLAQLLFIKGDDTEAKDQLQEAMRLQLAESAQLEAQFYLLAHVASNPSEILGTTKKLLARGARLSWDVEPNIETVRAYDAPKAALLELVRQVMTGEQDGSLLDDVLARWPTNRSPKADFAK